MLLDQFSQQGALALDCLRLRGPDGCKLEARCNRHRNFLVALCHPGRPNDHRQRDPPLTVPNAVKARFIRTEAPHFLHARDRDRNALCHSEKLAMIPT